MQRGDIVYVAVPNGEMLVVHLIARIEAIDEDKKSADVCVADPVEQDARFPSLLARNTSDVVCDATEESNTVLRVPCANIVRHIEESAPNGADYMYYSERLALPAGRIVRFSFDGAKLVASIAEHSDDERAFIQVVPCPFMNTGNDLYAFKMFQSPLSPSSRYGFPKGFLACMEVSHLVDARDMAMFRAAYCNTYLDKIEAMFATATREVISHVALTDDDNEEYEFKYAFTQSNSFLSEKNYRILSPGITGLMQFPFASICCYKGDVVYTWPIKKIARKPHPSGRQPKQWLQATGMAGLDAFACCNIRNATLEDVDRMRNGDGEHTIFSSIVLGYLRPRQAFAECPMFATIARKYFWYFDFQ